MLFSRTMFFISGSNPVNCFFATPCEIRQPLLTEKISPRLSPGKRKQSSWNHFKPENRENIKWPHHRRLTSDISLITCKFLKIQWLSTNQQAALYLYEPNRLRLHLHHFRNPLLCSRWTGITFLFVFTVWFTVVWGQRSMREGWGVVWRVKATGRVWKGKTSSRAGRRIDRGWKPDSSLVCLSGGFQNKSKLTDCRCVACAGRRRVSPTQHSQQAVQPPHQKATDLMLFLRW